MGITRKLLSVSTLGAVSYRSGKEQAHHDAKAAKKVAKQTRDAARATAKATRQTRNTARVDVIANAVSAVEAVKSRRTGEESLEVQKEQLQAQLAALEAQADDEN